MKLAKVIDIERSAFQHEILHSIYLINYFNYLKNLIYLLQY